jgi:beta-lactamase regulating signal transducer with metallopeptidase domain
MTPHAWAAVTWLAGAAALAAWVALSAFRLWLRVRRLPAVTDPAAVALLGECSREMGVGRPPRLVLAGGFSTPCLMGALRPRLLIPPGVLRDFGRDELRLIFLHEVGHQRRRDVAVNWLMTLLQAVHWFNPAVWLTLARVRCDRELACDELVLAVLSRGGEGRGGGASPSLNYGRTIVKLVEAFSGGAAVPGVIGFLEGVLEHKRQLKRRITMIAQFDSDARSASVGARRCAALAAALAVALAAVSLTDAATGEKAASTRPTKPATAPAAVRSGATVRLARSSDEEPQPLTGALVSANAADRRSAGAAAVQALLDHRLPEVKFDAVGFSDVIDFLRDVTGANVYVNWRTLEAAGVSKNVPVSIRLRDVTFAKALRTILEDAGGEVALDYSVDDGTLTISTREDLSRNVTIRVYDVTDLISRGADGRILDDAQQSKEAEQLIQLIKNTIGSDEWKDNGGAVGSIVAFNQKLTVTTTETRHREIAVLLAELTAGAPKDAAMEPVGR